MGTQSRLDDLKKHHSEKHRGIENDLMNGKFNAGCHCEALAAVEVFLRVRSNTPFTIGVSKPCCPVCYTLLHTIKEVYGHDFHIYRYHVVPSCTSLPSGLPYALALSMVDRFERYVSLAGHALIDTQDKVSGTAHKKTGLSDTSVTAEDPNQKETILSSQDDPDYSYMDKVYEGR